MNLVARLKRLEARIFALEAKVFPPIVDTQPIAVTLSAPVAKRRGRPPKAKPEG